MMNPKLEKFLNDLTGATELIEELFDLLGNLRGEFGARFTAHDLLNAALPLGIGSARKD